MPSKTKAHQRYRTSDGEIVPGATTIIDNIGWNKRVLMGWMRKEVLAGRDPYKVRDEAADIGTLAHALVEEHVLEELGTPESRVNVLEYSPEQLDKAENAFLGFLEWEDLHEVQYEAAELQLVSDAHRYGGTLDIVASVDGKLTLVDLKTSKGVYPSHRIQLAAYRQLWYEHNGFYIAPYLLRIDKLDGSFDPHPVSETRIEAGWEAFKAALKLHELQRVLK